MGSGFSKRKKQAKALQNQFAEMQEQLKKVEVTGSAGNGLVELVLNGENQLLSIKIKPECVDPEDVEGLELLIKAAHNDASEQLQKQSTPGGMAGLPDIPGLSGFGF